MVLCDDLEDAVGVWEDGARGRGDMYIHGGLTVLHTERNTTGQQLCSN